MVDLRPTSGDTCSFIGLQGWKPGHTVQLQYLPEVPCSTWALSNSNICQVVPCNTWAQSALQHLPLLTKRPLEDSKGLHLRHHLWENIALTPRQINFALLINYFPPPTPFPPPSLSFTNFYIRQYSFFIYQKHVKETRKEREKIKKKSSNIQLKQLLISLIIHEST